MMHAATAADFSVNMREIAALKPVIPLIAIEELAHAVPLAQALVRGGLSVFAFELGPPVALGAIEAVRRALPESIVGAAMLARAVDFAAAGRVGAQFGVAPGFTAQLAAAARGARFPLLPGVATASELIAARHAGYDTFTFFPAAQAGGIGMLKALARTHPEAMFCPWGGITREAAPAYCALPNVLCVAGSWPAPRAALRGADWQGIEALARDAAMIERP